MSEALASFALGVIEGFFGPPWSWRERADYLSFLNRHGYRFYFYAPKADRCLRTRWREDWSKEEWAELAALRALCRKENVLFGLGFTPYQAQIEYGPATERAIQDKMARLNRLEPDLLAVLFDDVPGIFADLAAVQCSIAENAFATSSAKVFFFCPTYYSDDPVFERALGPMPDGYLETLGRRLDPAVRIFWTGPEICARDYPEAHIAAIDLKLGRKPFLWDNYPVNDGPRMCKHLHLRAVTGRSPHLVRTTAGLAVNPMNQAHLSRIPLATLPRALYSAGYDGASAFREAAHEVCGPALARAIEVDLPLFHDQGLGGMSSETVERLRSKYRHFDHPCASEIVRWLDGAFEPDAEVLAEFADYV